jgi:hypothetical protein
VATAPRAEARRCAGESGPARRAVSRDSAALVDRCGSTSKEGIRAGAAITCAAGASVSLLGSAIGGGARRAGSVVRTAVASDREARTAM